MSNKKYSDIDGYSMLNEYGCLMKFTLNLLLWFIMFLITIRSVRVIVLRYFDINPFNTPYYQ